MHEQTHGAMRAQTQAALNSMHAYFNARRRGAPRQERDRLEQEWLEAIRRLRNPPR